MASDHMSKKRKRDVELPDEMFFEILSWLPAKSVCISKCCSKSFLNFTNSTNFALKQSQNSLLKDDSYFFIQDYFINRPTITIHHRNTSMDRRIRKTEIHPSLPSSSLDKVGAPFKFLHYVEQNSVKILASSNGLLLCQTPLIKGQRQLFICNPTTQSHSFIPSPITHGSHEHHGGIIFSFECDNNNDEDYKLYALERGYVQSPCSAVCKMYIPKEGVWKETQTKFFLRKKFFYMSFNQLSVFYNGAIHFIIDIPPNGLFIQKAPRWLRQLASYNVESCVSRVIKLPDGAVGYYGEVGIFKWGEVGSKKESICLVTLRPDKRVGYTFQVWVLSDHESSSGGWSKIFKVNLKELGLDRKCSQVTGFTVMNGRSLVFATETEVYDCDLSGKRKTILEKVCDHHQLNSRVRLFPYSDTLRSCGIGSTTLGV